MSSDLPTPAEALCHATNRGRGFAQAGNRFTLFGIMLYFRFGILAQGLASSGQAAER